MKTPMQELIRIMQETADDSRRDDTIAQSIRATIKLATTLLKEERKAIVDAFDAGRVAMVKTNVPQMPDIYYEKTFKQ